ncbi:lipase [Ephemerocybe angulata]|uniref:triacylglycerol lipase n=1 Tax=Ephemerocybe angulata TaxID=980116 RepID=A0A8H6M388_9AGAR|nr:lipase [Tulosesus angulatus]
MLISLPAHLILLLQTLLISTHLAGGAIIVKDDSVTGRIQTRPVTVYKPRSLEFLKRTRLRSLRQLECEAQSNVNQTERLEWNAVQVEGPDVEDRHTLAQLARMAGNAYALPGHSNWYDVDPAWNTSFPFGWEEGEGFRGHVFLSSDNNTVVLSIKGTTLNGPTSRLDKYNDNLLFSCCCARHAWVLRTVCDCYGSGWTCDNQCLSDALIEDSLFYSIGTKLVDDLLHIYPSANIWLVGHSLGGALSTLLGATYGLPAVALESPGERLAAQRLHLPLPPTINDTEPEAPSFWAPFPILAAILPTPRVPRSPPPPPPLAASITHVYHTADPIPFGTCSGLYSACASAGYALETKCHLGKSIWLVDVRKHVVKEVVKLLDVPAEGEDGVDWGDDGEGGGEDPEEPCRDPNWCFGGASVRGVVQRVWAWTLGDGLDVGVRGIHLPGKNKKKPGKGKKGEGEDGGEEKKKDYTRVPKSIVEVDCVDCARWEFLPNEEEKEIGTN